VVAALSLTVGRFVFDEFATI